MKFNNVAVIYEKIRFVFGKSNERLSLRLNVQLLGLTSKTYNSLLCFQKINWCRKKALMYHMFFAEHDKRQRHFQSAAVICITKGY